MNEGNPGRPDVKVSVAMITYNHDSFIRQAIESVLMQQTDFRVELVIGEDCSTDGTRAIVTEYGERFPDRIRLLLPEKNIGVKANGVAALKACCGQYIALLEGDDNWTDLFKLQKQVDFLDLHPEYVLCHHDAIAIDGDDHVVKESWLDDAHKRDYSARKVVTSPYFVTGTVCYRNVLPEMPPEYWNASNGDTFLFSMLGLFGGSKYLGNEIEPSRYRLHSGGIWSMLDKVQRIQQNAESFYWMGKYYARIGKKTFARHYMASSYHRSGRACAIQGNKAQAIGWMLRALGQKPWSPTLWRELLTTFWLQNLE